MRQCCTFLCGKSKWACWIRWVQVSVGRWVWSVWHSHINTLSGFVVNNEDTMQLVLKPVTGLFIFGISCCTVSYIENSVCTLPVSHAQHCTVNKVKARVSTYKNKDIIYIWQKRFSVFLQNTSSETNTWCCFHLKTPRSSYSLMYSHTEETEDQNLYSLTSIWTKLCTENGGFCVGHEQKPAPVTAQVQTTRLGAAHTATCHWTGKTKLMSELTRGQMQ